MVLCTPEMINGILMVVIFFFLAEIYLMYGLGEVAVNFSKNQVKHKHF